MKQIFHTRQFLIGHLATLWVGGLIYVLFRTPSLQMFAWFETLGMRAGIMRLRENFSSLPNGFLLYALPDGLWLFSYLSLVLLLWGNTINGANVGWFCMVPVLAILSELGQSWGWMPGTYDAADLLMYAMATILPFVIYRKSITFKPIQT